MSLSLQSLCAQLQVNFSGPPELILTHVCGLENLSPGGVAFLNKAEGLAELPPANACAFVVPPGSESEEQALIFHPDPLALHVQIAHLLHPVPVPAWEIHPTAFVGEGVELGEGVRLGPHVVLYEGVKIGRGSWLHAGVVVMQDCIIGEDCLIYPNVTIREGCQIGDRVILHIGAMIGTDGYGYFQRGGKHHKIPQIGKVILEDDVEIGAGCAISRARFEATIIGRGSKFDNLVHIAHNVELGPHALITGQVGIAGSVKTGSHLTMGGQSGIVDHVEIGNHVTLYAKSLITKNTHDGEAVAGIPARPAKQWKRSSVFGSRLEELFKRVEKLEKKRE